MRTFKDVCKEVTKEHDKFFKEGGGRATSSALLNVAVQVHATECNGQASALLRNGQASAAPTSAKPELYAHIEFEELYVFGLNAGKEQKNTLKFINGAVTAKSLDKSSETLEFRYTSATTGDVRFATFIKSNISGYSYTQADTVNRGQAEV